MPLSIAQFLERLQESELLDEEQVAALGARFPKNKRYPDAQPLIRELVEAQTLTQFQADALLTGRGKTLVLGDYVILREIGAGGMGQVFQARHRWMKRLVAVKVLPVVVTENPAAIKRFRREMEAAARLSHPNIVTAHDASEQKGIHYLVMEYIAGEDLARLVKRQGPLPVAVALDYISQTALGLAYAHRQGVIHRDIKPANLLLDTQGTIKILDMGLARFDGQLLGEAGDALTKTGSLMGTVDYMAPEQALNTKNADARSDVYSLGCTLFYLLTAKPLFEGDTVMTRLVAHREEPIPVLADHRADVPPALTAAFERMVAKKPADRFQSMDALLESLAACGPSDAAKASVSRGTSTNVSLGAATLSKPLSLATPQSRHEASPTAIAVAVAASPPSESQAEASTNSGSASVRNEPLAKLNAPMPARQVAANRTAATLIPDRLWKARRTKINAYLILGICAAVVFVLIAILVLNGNPWSKSQHKTVANLAGPDNDNRRFAPESANAGDSRKSTRPPPAAEPITPPADPARKPADSKPDSADKEVSPVPLADSAPLPAAPKSSSRGSEVLRTQKGIPTPPPEDFDMGGLSLRIIEAWEAAGFEFGWSSQDDFRNWQFTEQRPNDRPAIPCFKDEAEESFNGLPPPAVRFALDVRNRSINDDDLRNLEAFSELQQLDLFGSDVSDERLEAIAKLQQLQVLDLGHTKITSAGLAKLTPLRQLQSLGLSGIVVTTAGIKTLAVLPQLRVLDRSGTKVTNADLKELARLPGLQELDLSRTQLTDEGVRNLVGLQELQRLNVACTYVNDSGLKDLASLPKLSSLNLVGTKVSDVGLKELGGMAQLGAIYLDDTSVTIDGLREIAKIRGLRVLSLRNTATTDAGLENLTVLQQLETLYLNETQVTHDGLRHIAKLQELKTLDLFEANEIELGIKELAALRELRSLNLGRTRVTDAGLAALAGLENLEALDLSDSAITDEGLKKLAGLKRLTRLHLKNTNVTSSGLRELAGLQRLTWLNLDNTKVTDGGLKEIAGLQQLEWLSLEYTKVSDEGLKELSKLKNLQKLFLGAATNIEGTGFGNLVELPRLRLLNLNDSAVTDEGLRGVGKLHQLRWLGLSCYEVTDLGLKEIGQLQKLRELRLDHTMITDEGLKEISQLRQLRKLSLDFNKLGGKGLKSISNLQELKSLSIAPSQITDEGLIEIGKLMQLRYLRLTSNPDITDRGLKELTALKKLETLILDNTRVTREGIEELNKALPGVETLGPKCQ